MRKGIGLVWAIIILLLIASLMAAVTKIAFFSVKHTSDSYMIQRAQLFMHSAIENAILAIEGYDRSSGKCLKKIHFTDEDKRFEANITILRYYIYKKCPANCDVCIPVKTDFSNGYVLMDVKVASLNNAKNDKKKILLEKVTLQRP
ncbi:conserved hypothetical protein [Lebetimonas natsushimae]|uniref:Type II secretion system protein n=1 Tax=Lebetimonas natsushimae TaxID=1936991 RepID=A0A292YCK8_9BACT|nr:hypothetical protein [Lebetimonas natsushimae]GAX87075.1 conserved hypothetical protein [Lebetimonas natsushimae]